MNRPFFSIVTITYNDPNGFQKTAQSILAQNFSDFEWIIVHGGGDTHTAALVEGARAKRPDLNIVFISGEDTGLYNAMNIGMNKAQGVYLNFMNGGDRFYQPSVLSDTHAAIQAQSTESQFVYGDGLIETEDKTKLRKAIPQQEISAHWHLLQPAIHQAQYYLLDRVRELNLRHSEQLKIASDHEFTLLFIRGIGPENFLQLEKNLCVFDGRGISNERIGLRNKEQMQLIRRYFPKDYLRQIKSAIRLSGAFIVKGLLGFKL